MPMLRKRRRVAITIDMTPMVDIAFLLVIFFMCTYHARAPETVEINLPQSRSPFKVPESDVLTLKVTKGDEIYWNLGINPEQPVAFESLEQLLIEERMKNPRLRLVIKADKDARSGRMLDVMDVLQKTNNTRFSLVTILEYEGEKGG